MLHPKSESGKPTGSARFRGWQSVAALFLALQIAQAASALEPQAPRPAPDRDARIPFPRSVVAVAQPGAARASSRTPMVTRTALTADESAQTLRVHVALRMPHFAELQGRIHAGDKIPQEEMEARYLPPVGLSERLTAWFRSQGLTVEGLDSNHTNITLSGNVQDMARVFGVTFARVSTPYGEFTSATTAPTLPRSVADGVLSISGLQPRPPMHPERIHLFESPFESVWIC